MRVKGLFALKVDSNTDNFLLVSFSDESQVFLLNEGELDGTDLMRKFHIKILIYFCQNS